MRGKGRGGKGRDWWGAEGEEEREEKKWEEGTAAFPTSFLQINHWVYIHVWLGGRVVRTLDFRSIGREFESRPLRY